MDRIGRDSSVFKSNRLHILISSGSLQFKVYFIDSSEMIDDLPKFLNLNRLFFKPQPALTSVTSGQFFLIVISNIHKY